MSELTETDVQVLSWLYEYTVKHRHKELSAYIEAKCKARGIQPEFQFAKGFVVFVRHIQILTSKDLRKREHQKALIQLFEDLMRLRQFQALHRFYKKLIKLYVTTKLLVLNKQELNHDNILKEIPYFNWQQLQQDFGLMDDHFKTHFEVAIHSAHAAVQKCASKHKRILLLDRSLLHKSETYVQDSIPKLVSSLCEVFPCTALEKSPIQSSALEKNIGHHSCSSLSHKTSELEQTEQNTDMAVCGSELEQTEQNTDMAVCGSNMTASCSTSILAITAVEGFSSVEGNAMYSIGMQEHSGVSNVDESGDFKFDTALTQCGEKADMVDEYSEEDMTFHTAQESCNNTSLRDFDIRKVSDQNKRKEENDSLDSNIHQKKKIKVK